MNRVDEAVADFTAVIEDGVASDEARACALNNRADLLMESGDLAGATADRTSVMGLAETTYNRRFIALVRRARSPLRLAGDDAGAAE